MGVDTTPGVRLCAWLAHAGEEEVAEWRTKRNGRKVVRCKRVAPVHADFWFRLWDVHRIVAEDALGVIEELKKLANTRYHYRPVSLYGGMVELPLIVCAEDDVVWFSDVDVLTGGSCGRSGTPICARTRSAWRVTSPTTSSAARCGPRSNRRLGPSSRRQRQSSGLAATIRGSTSPGRRLSTPRRLRRS